MVVVVVVVMVVVMVDPAAREVVGRPTRQVADRTGTYAYVCARSAMAICVAMASRSRSRSGPVVTLVTLAIRNINTAADSGGQM